jgi:integrase
MPRVRRLTQFLHKRRANWYLRFRLPATLRRLMHLSEVRLSLGTTDSQSACRQARELLPHVYSIKRLARLMPALSSDIVERALRHALATLVAELERTKEPWFRHDPMEEATRRALRMGPIGDLKFMDSASVTRRASSDKVGAAQRAILQKEYSSVAPRAMAFLSEIGVRIVEPSPEFDKLCEELLKLDALYWQVDLDRRNGNFDHEERYLAPYLRRGLLSGPDPVHATREAQSTVMAAPLLSQAWAEFVQEKTAVRGRARWKTKTAATQQATFDEFLEIIGDIPVQHVTRDAFGRYLDVASKLPKNRRLRYPGKSIDELSKVAFPDSERLSGRSVAERMIHMGAFLKWCRETKEYLTTNSTVGLEIEASSQHYAPFTDTDLHALFLSPAYTENRHAKSWQFWLPLIGLYSGARLGEIVQLAIENVVKEDGIWVLVITDTGDEQEVKSRAGIRKVPISRKLIDVGLIEYAQALRDMGQTRLFGDLPSGSLTRQRNRLSRWFNAKYKLDCGIRNDPTGARKVFHSFRHTAITKVMTEGVPIAHCQQVFGHEKTMMGETATYTHEMRPRVLARVIEALDYGLDHSSYRGAWRAFV